MLPVFSPPFQGFIAGLLTRLGSAPRRDIPPAAGSGFASRSSFWICWCRASRLFAALGAESLLQFPHGEKLSSNSPISNSTYRNVCSRHLRLGSMAGPSGWLLCLSAQKERAPSVLIQSPQHRVSRAHPQPFAPLHCANLPPMCNISMLTSGIWQSVGISSFFCNTRPLDRYPLRTSSRMAKASPAGVFGV